jgi:hypothetical protein
MVADVSALIAGYSPTTPIYPNGARDVNKEAVRIEGPVKSVAK